MIRRDEYQERFVEHLHEREWDEVQILELSRQINRSPLLTYASALAILEYQQEVDEGIEAKRKYDELFATCDRPVIERTELAQSDFDSRRVDL